jgi:hypothetical protein
MQQRKRLVSWPDWIKNAGLVIVSFVLCTALAEVALRMALPETALLDPGDDDEFWKARIRAAIAEERDPGWRDIQFDATLGWRMTPNWRSEGVEHNARGYRASDEFLFTHEKPRALFIGDSFTYGLGVTNEETFSARFEHATGIEAINTGVNGFGIDQALLMWKNEGMSYAPDVLVLGYFVGNFNRNGLTVRDGPKPYFSRSPDEDGRFVLEGVPVPPITALVNDGFFDSGPSLRVIELIRYVQRRIYSRLDIHETEDNQEKAQINDFILRQLQDSATSANVRFLILIIGHCEDGVPEDMWIEERIAQSCAAHGIDCINMAAEMRQSDYDAFYGSNCHWSPRGHQLAADRIAEFLDQHQPRTHSGERRPYDP